MPFNPTLPVANSQIVSAELREQFNGLKELIDDLNTRLVSAQDQLDALQTTLAASYLTAAQVEEVVFSNSAAIIDGFTPFTGAITDPPSQEQVQAMADKLNELIDALQH